MKTTKGFMGLTTGLAAVAALGFGTTANAYTVTYLGDACLGTCVDLASAGYTVTGGAVIDPAVSITNVAKRPGTDTGNEADVLSYNVTSRNDNPEGAGTDILVTNLDGMFELYWGSVDAYNIIEFFLAGDLNPVWTFDGTDAKDAAGLTAQPSNFNFDGYYAFNGNFDSVVLSSEQGVAFELASKVPEPGTLALLGLGLVGLGAARRRRS